jgi:putative PIN family toxin of toxin-antitoxin system
MKLPQIALDTNIIVSALRSQRGASFKLFSLVGRGEFEFHLSVPLVLEYEDVLRRQRQSLKLTQTAISDLLDYLCTAAHLHEIHFLWRPYLPDPGDDMLLELATNAGCGSIVTYNKSDFRGAEAFGLEVVTAKEFLETIGALP